LVHDITPCDDLPNFEGLLSSCATEFPFAKRESTIVEEGSTGIVQTSVGTTENVPAAPHPEDGAANDPVKEINHKPLERKRRKLPEIPKIHQSKLSKHISSKSKKEKDQYLINCAHRIGFQTNSITRRRAIAIGYRVVVHFISIRTPSSPIFQASPSLSRYYNYFQLSK
jgi:hypothetical protein